MSTPHGAVPVPELFVLSLRGTRITVSRKTIFGREENFLSAFVLNHFSGRMPALVDNGALFLDHDPTLFSLVLDSMRDGVVADASNVRLLRELKFFGVRLPGDYGNFLREVANESKTGANAARFIQEADKQFRDCCHRLAMEGRFEVAVTSKWGDRSQMVVFDHQIVQVPNNPGVCNAFMEELSRRMCATYSFRLVTKKPDGSFTLSWLDQESDRIGQLVQILESCSMNGKWRVTN